MKKIKIFVNASNVRFGGGVTVAKNIIRSILQDAAFGEIMLLLPQNSGYGFEEKPELKIIYISDRFHNHYFYKLKFIRKGFSQMIDALQPDVVFSLGNVAFPCRKPHLLLIQNAYLFYPESDIWNRMPFGVKTRMKMANLQTRSFLRYADHYLVQTTVIKKRLHSLFHVPDHKIDLLPNVISYQSKDIDKAYAVLPRRQENIRLLLLSKYYPHKNYDILLPLAGKIALAKAPVQISLTVKPDDHPDLLRLQRQLEAQRLEHIIRFIGDVDAAQIDEVFRQHDGTLLPTLLESFSGTYIESMFYGRPVFTSDLDFAHVVCGQAAYYFNPDDAANMLRIIMEAYSNEKEMQEKIEEGYRRIAAMPDWAQLSAAITDSVKRMLNHQEN